MVKSRIRHSLFQILVLLLGIMMFCSLAVAGNFESLHGDMGENISFSGVNEKNRELRKFKVFIPPGTWEVILNVFCVNDARNMYAVAGFKTPPPENPGEPPFYDEGWGHSLKDLGKGHRFSLNRDGLIKIISEKLTSTISEKDSGWLYVRVFGGWDVKSIKFTVRVNSQVYNSWYNTIDWYADVDSESTYVPPTPNPSPPKTDPTPSDPPPSNSDDDAIWGDRDPYVPPPSNGGNRDDSNCTNPFLCGFDGYTPPAKDPNDSNPQNPFDPSNPPSGDGDDQTGTTDPIVRINCGRNNQKEITSEDLEGRTVAIPLPRLTTSGISESLNYYAMIIVGPKMYIAVKDEFNPEIISFIEYQDGDRLRSYKSGPLEMSSYWDCDVFAETLYDMEVPVQVMAEYGVRFLCGYAPAREAARGNLSNLQYVDLCFSPSLR